MDIRRDLRIKNSKSQMYTLSICLVFREILEECDLRFKMKLYGSLPVFLVAPKCTMVTLAVQ